MSEMVERVARAICQNVHGGNDPCTEDYQAARAAIEAMLEPTEAMLAAGSRARPYNEDDGYYDGSEYRANTAGTWQEMIDAALASEPKP